MISVKTVQIWKIFAEIFGKMEMLGRFSRKVSRILPHLMNDGEISHLREHGWSFLCFNLTEYVRYA
jgi:hypothetical protein